MTEAAQKATLEIVNDLSPHEAGGRSQRRVQVRGIAESGSFAQSVQQLNDSPFGPPIAPDYVVQLHHQK